VLVSSKPATTANVIFIIWLLLLHQGPRI